MNLSFFRRRIETMSPWRRGTSCEIFKVRYAGQLFCCKRIRREDPLHSLSKELHVLKLLNQHGYFPGPVCGSEEILVYPYIAGRVLGFPVRYTTLVARFMRAYHSITGARETSVRSYLESQHGILENNLEHACKRIRRRTLASALWRLYVQTREADQELGVLEPVPRFTPCLIHFDPHPRNIIACRELRRVLFVDWSFASFGDPALDIAQFFEKARVSVSQARHFYHAYGADRALEARAAYYVPFLKLNSLCWKVSFGHMTEAILARSVRRLHSKVHET